MSNYDKLVEIIKIAAERETFTVDYEADVRATVMLRLDVLIPEVLFKMEEEFDVTVDSDSDPVRIVVEGTIDEYSARDEAMHRASSLAERMSPEDMIAIADDYEVYDIEFDDVERMERV